MVNDYKELHVRLTHIDCINAQEKLLQLMQTKIRNNSGLSTQEEYNFSALVSNALLSMGQHSIYYNTTDNAKIPLGSLHSMLLKMVGLRGKNVTLQYFNKKYVISMLNIWTLLKNECISYFPSALQEAIHISREMPKREEPSTYIFGKDRKLEK